MPWTPADAERHVAGLTAHQATIWARVANRARAACIAEGRSPDACDATAIRQANTVAQRAPAKAIKVAASGALTILAIPFFGSFAGGPAGKGVDSDGEWFSERTSTCADWFPDQRPLLYHHGLDAEMGLDVIGRVTVASGRKDAAGWWYDAQLDKRNRYYAAILKLIDDEALDASSGAMSHLVKIADDGEILQWPWVELSLTPTPSNPYAIVQPAEAKAHYKSAGLDLADTREKEPGGAGFPAASVDEGDALDIIETVGLGYGKALEALLASVPEFMARTKSFEALRLKDGRPQFSTPRRQRLAALLDAFRAGAADLEALLAETEPRSRDEAAAVAEALVGVADAAALTKATSRSAELARLRARLAAWHPPYPIAALIGGHD